MHLLSSIQSLCQPWVLGGVPGHHWELEPGIYHAAHLSGILVLQWLAGVCSCFPVVLSALCLSSWVLAFIGLGSFSFSVPPFGDTVTNHHPLLPGRHRWRAIAPLGHPWAGFEGLPDARQTDVHHYRRQTLFSASHRAHAWVQKVSAVCPRSHAGVKPRSHPTRSNHSACKHLDHAHEASPQMSRFLYCCLLPPPYTTLCVCRAEQRPRCTSPASSLSSSPSLSKFWGEEEATKIDGFPHRQQAQAWVLSLHSPDK